MPLTMSLFLAPGLVGGSPGMVCQAVGSRAGFVVTHMGVFAPVPVVTAGSLLRSGAASGPVEMIAHAVPLELGAPTLHY